jgi:hypothetical protein
VLALIVYQGAISVKDHALKLNLAIVQVKKQPYAIVLGLLRLCRCAILKELQIQTVKDNTENTQYTTY